ncbi:MAG: amidohydrolase family protein [Gemmatimonadetes bacterium]|nr:amidohydrolase family protein [Gemmatimonadota bacterium]MDA1102017.1 amidohydrolase family protein [Gemmatimonadota bacterium]
MKRSHALTRVGLAIATMLAFAGVAEAQQGGMEVTTPRQTDEGDGPHERLILRGAIVIDGTGAPPQGPMDIVIENDRIVEVRSVGFPMAPINESRRPQGATREIDVSGMYITPGLVDMHAHTGGAGKAPQAEYVYKLWMGNGITTSRGVGHGPMMWGLEQKALAERNQIVAPRMFTYARPGEAWDRGVIDSPEKAREWVRWAAAVDVDGAKIDGLKLTSEPPAIMAALIDEAHRHGLGTVAHLAQTGVAEMNALDAARLGLDMMTHYYGLFEAMLTDYSLQNFPLNYNYNNEQDRFGQVGRLWYQSAERGSEQWNALIEEFLELDFGIDPTMTIYEASRDLMRATNAEWHDEYTLPSQWEFYQPSRQAHGSYWYYWTSEDEYHWGMFYEKWMQFLNDYKNAGGIVTTGSDSGFIYKLYGFDYIRELELLREAGFHPLEVLRAATYHGALQLHKPSGMEDDLQFGVVRAGMKADLIVVDRNPLENLKVLYGTGAPMLNDETGELERVGGITYTIKDGIVYDAKQLLEDVREMVRLAKERSVTQDGTP